VLNVIDARVYELPFIVILFVEPYHELDILRWAGVARAWGGS
jgi:hypothetical protein